MLNGGTGKAYALAVAPEPPHMLCRVRVARERHSPKHKGPPRQLPGRDHKFWEAGANQPLNLGSGCQFRPDAPGLIESTARR